jgi:hypothetical protein
MLHAARLLLAVSTLLVLFTAWAYGEAPTVDAIVG